MFDPKKAFKRAEQLREGVEREFGYDPRLQTWLALEEVYDSLQEMHTLLGYEEIRRSLEKATVNVCLGIDLNS